MGLPEEQSGLTQVGDLTQVSGLTQTQSIFNKTQSDPSTAAKRTLDASVARVSPALYAAGSRASLTREEKNLIENWSQVREKHQQLMKMSNKDAADSFTKLEPGFQEALKQYYKIDYAKKNDGQVLIQNDDVRKALGIENSTGDGNISYGDVAKSPFQFLMGAATQYGKFINTPGSMLQNSVVNKESFWSRSNGEVAFDGKYLYDNDLADELVNKYGGAESFVAMHVLAGDTPGEIIDAWGPNDPAILAAVNTMFNEQEAFNVMLGEFSRAQLSPGRIAGRFLNEKLGIDTNNNTAWFSVGTGAIDFAYQIFADPLTYLTLGASAVIKGASKAEKLANMVKSGADVNMLLGIPEVASYYGRYTKLIGELGGAMAINATTSAAKAAKASQVAQITRKIEMDHADIASPDDIKTWLDYGVTDLDSFKNLFAGEGAKEWTRLIRGKTVSTVYAREGVAYSKRSRESTIKVKKNLRNIFLGKEEDIATGTSDYEKVRAGLLGDEPLDIEIAINKKQNTFQRFIERQTRLHPGRSVVYHDDANLDRTIDVFNKQAFLALGRRDLADMATAEFRYLPQAERFAMHRSIFEMIMRREGIHGLDGGQAFIDNALELHFGSKNTWTTAEELAIPSRSGITNRPMSIAVTGPLHSSQFQNFVTAPDWRGISEFVASKSLKKNKDESLVDYIPKLIGGAYNSRATGIGTDLWTTLTLIPQLGIRTAIEEGFMFFMYAKAGMIRNYRTSKQYQRIWRAAKGEDDKSGAGPIKAGVETLLDKTLGKTLGRSFGVSRSISQETRARLRKDVLENNKDLPKWKQDELIGETILDAAIFMHGTKLAPAQTRWFKELVMENPQVLHSISQKNVTDSLQGKTAIQEFGDLLSDSQLDMAMDELGLIAQGAIKSFQVSSMKDSHRDIAMFRNFTRIFNDKGFEARNGKDVTRFSFASVLLKHNAGFSSTDWANASDELMRLMGFVKNSDNAWVVGLGKEDQVKKILEGSRFFDQWKDLANPADKMQEFIIAGLSDTYVTLHGSSEVFNPKIAELFQDVAKGKDHRKIMGDISFEDYVEATKGFKVQGHIMTDIKFDGVATDLRTAIQKYGQDQAFDLMARQTDAITRLPVTHMHYIAFRKQYEETEFKMAEDLHSAWLAENKLASESAIKRNKEIAEEQASKFFTNKAINDAAGHVLKFSDNPAMQTVFAYNMRTVGRFYRAVEDFHRRMYRLVKDHPLDVIYRLRLMNQGLDAVGDVHTDDDGNKYVVLPMDDVIYSAVDTTIRTLTNETASINQPLFNDITFKLTAGNPSFQDDAGMPYLSGPMGSLSVVAAKSMLGILPFDETKNISEDLDNWFMGSMGDNATISKSLTPKFARNIWSMLNVDEQSTQEISALTQAISYNEANNIKINPDDPKYKYADGTLNEALLNEDKVKYLRDLRIGAHNIIVTRALLGMILPFSVQTKNTKDVPPYLLDSGITSMQQSFYEVLDQVKDKYPDANDHYEMALATWMGENPGKAAYLVSKKSKEIQPIVNYSNEMQDWTIANQDAVDQYGAGALLFAPKIGEFSPGVWQWASAAGIAKNVDIDSYYQKVWMQEYVNNYYDLGDQEALELKAIPLHYTAERRALLAKYDKKKAELKQGVPGLEFYIQNTDNNEAYDFVNNAYNYVTSPGADAPEDIKQDIAAAYNLYTDFIYRTNYIDSLNAANGTELKRAEKEKTVNAIKELIKSDSTRTIEQYYNYGLKKLINATTRDAKAGIWRNE
jgi:hypothetical protein